MSTIDPKLLEARFSSLEERRFSITWEWPRGNDPDKSDWEGREDYWDPHFWEVGRKSYPRSRLLSDIKSAGLQIKWAVQNPRFRYHLFILTENESG